MSHLTKPFNTLLPQLVLFPPSYVMELDTPFTFIIVNFHLSFYSLSFSSLTFPFFFSFFFFYAETEQGVAQAIIRSVIDFKRDPWPKVSDNAKDLVRKMLNPDPKRRLTAQEVLGRF